MHCPFLLLQVLAFPRHLPSQNPSEEQQKKREQTMIHGSSVSSSIILSSSEKLDKEKQILYYAHENTGIPTLRT